MLTPFPGLVLGHQFSGGAPYRSTLASTAIDAVGESVGGIGYVRLTSGPGTSRTISSSGGSISFCVPASAVVWANATTKVRVGIQAVDVGTGNEDGTWLVYGELTGGDASIAESVVVTCPMSSGSLSISDGALYAIVVEMTVKGGADSARVAYVTSASSGAALPYCTIDTGTGPARSSNAPVFCITFDDADTFGYFDECLVPFGVSTASPNPQGFSTSSAADEFATIITMPFTCVVDALYAVLTDLDSGDDGSLKLYADPLSPSPVVLATASVTGLLSGAAASSTIGGHIQPIPPTVLTRGQTYAVSYLATTSTARTLNRSTHDSAKWRRMGWLGENVTGGYRDNSTGAFIVTDTHLPAVGAYINAIDIPLTTPRTRNVRSV